jgi:hypothetical protein
VTHRLQRMHEDRRRWVWVLRAAVAAAARCSMQYPAPTTLPRRILVGASFWRSGVWGSETLVGDIALEQLGFRLCRPKNRRGETVLALGGSCC